MKLLTIQTALFPLESIARPDLEYSEINRTMGTVFDAMPTIIELPENAPNEIPLVQAHSSDGRYKLNISRSRIDCIIGLDIDVAAVPHETFESNKQLIMKFVNASIARFDVFRIGVVITMFEKRKNNVYSVYEKYIKLPFSERCMEVNLRYNETRQIKGMVINNIRTVEAANLHIERHDGTTEDQTGVSIQIDVNNQPNPRTKLTLERITSILDCAREHLNPETVKGMI